MSFGQHEYPEWMWDGSMTNEEIEAEMNKPKHGWWQWLRLTRGYCLKCENHRGADPELCAAHVKIRELEAERNVAAPVVDTGPPFSHPLFQHRNGDKCVWIDGTGWFIPYDAGGEGAPCPLDHPADLTSERERIAQAIEAEFKSWDALGGPHAPYPLHSEGWLVERAYANCAAIARREPENDDA